MEVKINREIREYTESIFFGLSIRQFFFSISACVIAVCLYFILKPYFGIETLSWVCILAVIPFAILGFVKYNGMPAEKFISAWVKSEILIPKKLVFKPVNLYAELLQDKEREKKRIKKSMKEKIGKKGTINSNENIKQNI